MKCIAIDRTRANCRNYGINDTQFCKLHQYMCDYTPEMMNNLSICSGCKKCYYLSDGRKTCDTCGQRGKKIRDENLKEVVKCKHNGCKFKQSELNQYCLKHQLDVFLDEVRDSGKKTCKNAIRGCREIMELDDEFVRCLSCRMKERETDNTRRSKVVENYNQITYTIEDGVEIALKTCTVCLKDKKKDQFIPERGDVDTLTKTCQDCRNQQKILDSRRDVEHRNEVARKNEAKPERKAVKKEWAENNYEKVVLKHLNYRSRQIGEKQEEYLERNAENMKQWRERNQEKVAEINNKKLNSINANYKNLRTTAPQRGHSCELTLEEYSELVTSPCYYCGETETHKTICGIDRLDSNTGYVSGNCVSCCKMCNLMKGALHKNTFLMRIEHILTHIDFICGKRHPHLFADHIGSSIENSRRSAFKRGYVFELTEDQYYNIISEKCYMCGKENTHHHINGIDRYDPTIGYVYDNYRPCCFECNTMKRDNDYDDMVTKFVKIYNNFNTYIDSLSEEVPEHGINTIRKNNQKKSREDIREESRIKKQIQRQRQREKYGDEEFRRMKAAEMAEQRRKRKEKETQSKIDNNNDNK